MSYLFPFAYLYLHSITYMVIDGREILIQKPDFGPKWKLSTPIFDGQGEFPPETHACLKIIQQLRWENEGVLEIDAVTGTIHWVQEVEPSRFDKEFPRFLKHAQEWAEILTQKLFSAC